MKIKKARELRNTLIIAGFVIILLSYIWESFLIIGTIIMLSCIIPDWLYNKCPHCGKHLGRNEGDFCQHCGKLLDI